MADKDDDDIPLLDEVVRTGREAPARSAPAGMLSEAEIEAIAARVVERHTREMEQAVARAIRAALDKRARDADGGNGSGASGDQH